MAIVPDVVGLLKGDALSVLKLAGFTNVSVNSVRYAAKIANRGTIQNQSVIGFTASLADPILITAYEVLSQQVTKRVEIPLEDQPYMTDDGKYYLRYRVVSESGVSTSEWSPVSVLEGKPLSEIFIINANITITSDDYSMFVNWEIPETIKNTTFDVYISWSLDGLTGWTDWSFGATTTGKSFSVKIPAEYRTINVSTPHYMKAWIQIPTKQKNTSTFAKIGESIATSTRPAVTDGIVRT
jgi:hypothetical protein